MKISKTHHVTKDGIKKKNPISRNPVVGRKIIGTRQMTQSEIEAEGWYRGTTVLILDNGTLIYPSQDDEGNDSGALFGKTKEGLIRVGYQSR